MPNKWTPIDIGDLVLRYINGESEKAIAESIGISRYLLRKRLVAVGVQMRGRSEAMYTRMARSTPEQRSQLAAAAHDAVRGMTRTTDELEAAARSRERKHLGNASAAELKLAEMLQAEGLDVTRQKAIGKYNVDLAAGSVAVELLGGSWHRTKRHRERLRYLLDSGWDVIFVWVDARWFPLGSEAAQYVVAHLKFRERNPAAPRCYRVIRGTGQFLAGGSADGDNIPDVLPNHGRPEVAPAEVPFGFCRCGCGRKTTITPQTNRAIGAVKGEPRRYISGHNRSRHPR